MLKLGFDVSIDEYRRLSIIRNNLDVIHLKPTDERSASSAIKLKLEDLYSLFNIYYVLIAQKEFH